MNATGYLETLNNHIDIAHIPFSDRGSRLLVFQYPFQSGLYVKLAERLTQLEPDIEAYLHRPPFIQELCLIDADGYQLEFEVTTTPYCLQLHTRLGDFELVFQNQQTLAFDMPPGVVCGLRFRVFPQYWQSTAQGGKFMSVLAKMLIQLYNHTSCAAVQRFTDCHLVMFTEKGSVQCWIKQVAFPCISKSPNY